MGVDLFEDIRGICENSPFNKQLGIKLEKIEEGSVVYSLATTPLHLSLIHI